MSVNYRELLKNYIKHVDKMEGVHMLEHESNEFWGEEEWEALKEILRELDFWYAHE